MLTKNLKRLTKNLVNRLKRKRFIKDLVENGMFHGRDGVIHIYLSNSKSKVIGKSVRDHGFYEYKLNDVFIIRHGAGKKEMLSNVFLGLKDWLLLFSK